jgi:uncharacterized protein YgbK (DUF1537 family)
MLLGAIADDLTGATDLALMLAREGMRTVQVVGVPDATTDLGNADAVVVSLKSRTIPAADAVAQSLASAKVLLGAGAQQLFFKYCSTFDSTNEGNIGPVAESLLALLGERRTLACPAFPANRRTVYQGHLFVGDVLLSESSMRDHPLTPMRDANLVRVLQAQTKLPVSLVAHETVRGGAGAIGAAFDKLDGIAIVDAIADADLRSIGAAAKSLKLVTGGSGVAMGLPANFRAAGLLGPLAAPSQIVAPAGRPVILAGSCSAATRRQVAAAIAAGHPALRIDALDIAAGRLSADDVVNFVTSVQDQRAPLVYSSADPSVVADVQEKLGTAKAGALVEDLLGAVAARLAKLGFSRFLVAGGETSGAVVAALGVKALEIGAEIDPGVPWTLSTGAHPLALALKSGNFGTDDFFIKAWDALQ